jgi:hypothetical protein
MMMSKAIILPFFLLAGLASGSQQPQGIVSNTYYDEDVEGGSLQRVTAPSGEDDGAQQEDEVVFGDDGAANLELEEDEYAVDSTATEFYDHENNNADDEEVVDESRRRQLRGNSNLRLNRNNSAECMVGYVYRNCPKGQTCWRKRVGDPNNSHSWYGNGVCIPNDACLPTDVFARFPTRLSLKGMARDCCSRRAWEHSTRFVCY